MIIYRVLLITFLLFGVNTILLLKIVYDHLYGLYIPGSFSYQLVERMYPYIGSVELFLFSMDIVLCIMMVSILFREKIIPFVKFTKWFLALSVVLAVVLLLSVTAEYIAYILATDYKSGVVLAQLSGMFIILIDCILVVSLLIIKAYNWRLKRRY